MAVKTKKYISRGGNVVRAIKVTEKNYIGVSEWAAKAVGKLPNKTKDAVAVVHVAKDGDESNHRVKLHIDGVGIRVAKVGEYVAKNQETGEIFVGKDWFEEKYSEVK